MKTFISTDDGRKVHFEFDFQAGRPSCNSGNPLTARLVEVEGEGIEGTVRALAAAEVAVSRLCKKCFYVRARRVYAAAIEGN